MIERKEPPLWFVILLGIVVVPVGFIGIMGLIGMIIESGADYSTTLAACRNAAQTPAEYHQCR